MNNNNNNMAKPRKFVYSTGSNSKKQNNSSDHFSWNANMPNGEVDDFELALDFDDDDITNSMSAADFDRLEFEASKKLGLQQANTEKLSSFDTERRQVEPQNLVSKLGLQQANAEKLSSFDTEKRQVEPQNIVSGPSGVDSVCESNSRKVTSSPAAKAINPEKPRSSNALDAPEDAPGNARLQQLSAQLDEFKSKVVKLESCMCDKDGELKILRSSLEKHRQESGEKSEKIMLLKNNQHAERSGREASLVKEVASLKTKLSFQDQELIEQSRRIQSQTKTISITGGVKRKADLGTLNSPFDLDNSFITTQQMPSNKIPRISEVTGSVKIEPTLRSSVSPGLVKIEPTLRNSACSIKKENIDKPVDLPSALTMKRDYFCTGTSERTALQLVKKLILTHSDDCTGDQDMSDTISLLNLLKYPLKHLPEVLKAHCVNTCVDEPGSQFPLWQSQKLSVGPVGENPTDTDVMDLDSGKYGLVTQGIFMLLGVHGITSPEGINNPHQHVSPSLGVTHILVLLELCISSYLHTRESMMSEEKSNVAGLVPGPSCKGIDTEWQKSFIDNHEMVILTLQILRLLFYSEPSLVNLVLDRTDASVIASNDVIVIDDDSGETKQEEVKECPEKRNVNAVKDESKTEHLSMESFRSLLLQNLEKLIIPHSDESLTVSYAALDVLVAMTSFCEEEELERIFLLLKRGCLFQLLAKDSGRSSVLPVMSLLKNLLPCKDIHKILCSRTDDCILLKIYQCACEEDDETYTADALQCRQFLLQVVKFLKHVALNHSDSIEFLLETDCQCSSEIIRCLVLILHDKVNYLLGLDPDIVTSDESLLILRIGITLLAILCTHSNYSVEHKLDVERHYIELIYNVMILYKNIKDFIPDVEALGVQDLLDFEEIQEIEWSINSCDEDEEFMEIDA